MSAALSREETVALIRRAQDGDVAASEELVEANIPLVKSIVKRFLGRGCDYEDLFQLGSMGLYKAILGFDASLETQFSTYAVPLIMGEIRRHFRDDGAVKVSRPLKQLGTKAVAEIARLRAETGNEPTIEKLAAILEASAEELLLALDSLKPVQSLDAPLDEERGSLYALLGAAGDESGTVEMRDMIERLEERERIVVVMRYFRGVTQGEIARVLGLSQAQVSRIESRALGRLREAM